MKAVILLSAKNRKLYPFTESVPKCLINIAGTAIVDSLLQRLKSVEVNEVLFIVNDRKQLVSEHIGHNQKYRPNISYVDYETVEQIPDVLASVKDFLKSETTFKTYPKYAVAAIAHPPVSGHYHAVYINSEMGISKVEHSALSEKPANYVLAGAFVLSVSALERIEAHHFNIYSYFNELAADNGFRICIWEDLWIDIKYPWDILNANRMIMDTWTHSSIASSAVLEKEVYIKGPVIIGENVRICSGTSIIGPCFIGDNTFIGNNVLIREYANIGADSSIGYGTEIKNAAIFGNVKIGRLSFIGDSVLGFNVNFGSCSMTINYNTSGEPVIFQSPDKSVETQFEKLGAFIGDGASVGSNHSIMPGLVIRPGYPIPDHITVDSRIYAKPDNV
ncbi:hypothetical protein CHS0354_035367 [Potamilus streckersoni]|uniref:Uncharacterized protein n=1 Tax=Potamilus streckersoni TaxID=2493646 RepID=A0AAE0S2R1_9BIVA|nr:hypothetical protein CHS0354_035367 [Potamilus streckersoni]